ncbi:MAG TPA: FAD-dependent oxidoreductase [Rubricoccaceae bacterium]
MSRLPIVVVGAGLAGACAALALARSGPVVVLDAVGPAAGASGAAAGLVNAFTGRRGARAWRAAEARAALDRAADRAGVPIEASGVLRPAGDARQAQAFADAAALSPAEAQMWTADAASERWPGVAAPLGALWIPGGGHVDVPRLVHGLLAAAERDGAVVRSGVRVVDWAETPDGVNAITDSGDVEARALVLCPGRGVADLPRLAGLAFGHVKGQTVMLAAHLPPGLPAVSGGVYIVPTPGGAVVGATFEHTFADLDPSLEASLALRDRAARLVPALADAPVVDARAGARLTVPASVSPERLPHVGALSPRVWLFAGLGSRGLLTAPLLAETLGASLTP